MLLLLFSGLAWSLPPSFARDIPLAILVLYWINPLPSHLFGLLRIWMQAASVTGSEWILHIFNVRVWGDGLVLRTGVYVFEVPAWCSGMRTATTVFILSLALGILRRMRAHEITIFVIWSLFHALLLNIIRICIMIFFAPHTHAADGLEFLHNSAGIVVIGGVLIVYLEMLYLEHRKQWQHHIKTEINQSHFENISEYPPFWKRILKHRRILIWAAVAAAVVITLIIRSRPYHRAMMIGDVVTELRDRGDLINAQRGALVVSKMIPDDIRWKFTSIRLKMISGRHQQVVDELESLRDLPPQYRTVRQVLLAYSLMYLGRIDEAAAIVEKLPDDIRNSDPRVAMIMAEMALRGGDSDAVAVHVITASAWAPNVGRIRNLYPYLHIHRQWQAMVDSDIKVPYNDPVQAFSILEAYMQLDRVPRVADITLQSVSRWPLDMRALEPLYFMAIKRGNATWENRFAEHLLRCTAACNNPDVLYETIYKCFALSRPDLAWAVFEHIRNIDPQHPTIYMIPAKYGHKWFVFRKRRLGIPATQPSETINLKPFFILGHYLPQWKDILSPIPYGEELSESNPTPARKQFLKKAITLFENKSKTAQAGNSSEPALTLDMQYLYALALEMNARIDLAKKQLQNIVEQYPAEKDNVRIMLSEIYERKGDWINVYENLRTYLTPDKHDSISSGDLSSIKLTWPPTEFETASAENVHLKPLLRLIKSQLKLKMRLSALHTARETVRLFPYSAQAVELLAQAQLELGDAESTLKLLEQPRLHDIRNLDIIEAEALFKTERFKEISPFCRSAMLPQLRIPPDTIQQTSLPPAELSLLWHRVSIPSEEQFRQNAEHLRSNLSTASPGLRKMLSLWIKGYEQHCSGESASLQLWFDCGRDPLERATSLNQLTLLLCREELYSEAKLAARKAVTALPNEPILWRILISLSDTVNDTVERARQSCPDDPELWLAELVFKTHPDTRSTEVRGQGSEVGSQQTKNQKTKNQSTNDQKLWLSKTISEAIDKQMPPATLTRAGEYLWRSGMRPEAVRLARNITGRARGLLPAYIFTMRCALYEKDEKWALQCTKEAIQSALQPLPEFYENLVNLKVADGKIDTEPDMVNALRNLRKTDPDNPAWAQMLGYIRFQRGGWEIVDAMFQMQSAINNGATNPVPYLIASEASRLLRNYDRAIDILHQGLKHNPDNYILINNLAFTMTHSPKYVDDAAAMIPLLKQLSVANPQIKDTLAAVYIHTSRLDSAIDTIKSILNNTRPGSPIWFRAKTHLAEIAWLRGQKADAVALLNGLLKNLKQIPDEDILRTNALLTKINENDEQKRNTIPDSP